MNGDDMTALEQRLAHAERELGEVKRLSDEERRCQLIQRAHQAWERLLDAYQDGLISKADFESRAKPLRERDRATGN
jgi:hypothetical protein